MLAIWNVLSILQESVAISKSLKLPRNIVWSETLQWPVRKYYSSLFPGLHPDWLQYSPHICYGNKSRRSLAGIIWYLADGSLVRDGIVLPDENPQVIGEETHLSYNGSLPERLYLSGSRIWIWSRLSEYFGGRAKITLPTLYMCYPEWRTTYIWLP